MNMKNQWLFETPFSLPEIDYMARLSDNLHKEQRQTIRGLARQIAELMAHRNQSRQSSLGRHEEGIARKTQDITGSAFKAIDRGISYGQVVTQLKVRLQSLNNRRQQAQKKSKLRR
ncbi:MAG: hypothetical protein V7L22_07635 [Nostoc sp.]|uniref:hypothetical protein n=1 Tax=Nostoc sp. TaxID=1180 RepID=UPI002FF6B91D